MANEGEKTHKFNHVKQNIKLAAKFNYQKSVMMAFKKSVLAKNNETNLKIIIKKKKKDEE